MSRGDYVVKVLDHSRREDLSSDNIDVVIYFADGTKYMATFFTLENLRHLFVKNRSTGECASGKYLWAANMIIVESLDDETIKTAVADLIATGEFGRAFEGPHQID
jgi:hypothetical protein